MAESHGAHGDMEIQDQKETFHGFLSASVWGSGLVVQLVALLTLGFAIGMGWWAAGFVAFLAFGAWGMARLEQRFAHLRPRA